MKQSPRRIAYLRILGFCLVASWVLLAGPDGLAKDSSGKNAMKFAADMATRGNWREASFRWEKLLSTSAGNAKIYNNLAVASEAIGKLELASEWYAQALDEAGGDPIIVDNYRRYGRLINVLLERDTDGSEDLVAPDFDFDEEGKTAKGKATRVGLMIPIPARIDLDGFDSILVTGFRANESALIDVNRELARFLRGELRQRTALEVCDVVPPPAIPEQQLDDLAANTEFWKHLGREYDADLIVSGIVTFGRAEVSGFEDIDVVNPQTGQKVRQSQFVEREEFSYVLDLLFIEGATGEPLHRDRLKRQVRFRGLSNDPLHAFYELSESLGDDIVSVVSTRMRTESRVIFKR